MSTIRIRGYGSDFGEFAVSWDEFKAMVNDAEPPEGTYVCRGSAGNLVLVDAEGGFRGFIDHTGGQVDPCGTWGSS